MAVNCLRYFGFKSLREVEQVTIPEYETMMEAHALRQVDEEYKLHLLAWLTFAAQAKKSAGKGKEKPVYGRFRKFFNYESRIREVKAALGGKPKDNSRFVGIGKYLRKGGEADGAKL